MCATYLGRYWYVSEIIGTRSVSLYESCITKNTVRLDTHLISLGLTMCAVAYSVASVHGRELLVTGVPSPPIAACLRSNTPRTDHHMQSSPAYLVQGVARTRQLPYTRAPAARSDREPAAVAVSLLEPLQACGLPVHRTAVACLQNARPVVTVLLSHINDD